MFHHLDNATLIKITRFYFFWRKCCHFDFRQGMGFTTIFEKKGEKNGENWSEIEFTSFGENAITLIFARGRESLGFLKKKNGEKMAKIGQKLNSLLLAKMPSLQFSPRDGIHYDFRKKRWKKGENWSENKFCILPPQNPPPGNSVGKQESSDAFCWINVAL